MTGGWLARGLALGMAVSLAFFSASALAQAKVGAPPVQLHDTEEGMVFATTAGMTLYTNRQDAATPGKSRCNDIHYTMQNGRQFGQIPLPAAQTRKTCADKWPAFLASADAQPKGDWSTILRENGRRQWAYNGLPLYTSAKDHRPGDVNGVPLTERVRNGWSAAMAPVDLPPGFKLVRREEGLALATSDGRPVYLRHGGRMPAVDTGPALIFQPIAAPSFGKVAGKWSIVDSGGFKQYAFLGEPLFALAEGYGDGDVQNAGGWAPAIYRRAMPPPAQIKTRLTLSGKIYTTAKGLSLYAFSCAESEVPDGLYCDDPGDAAAYWSALCGDAKECSRRWRPYAPDAMARPSGDFTIEEVSDPPFVDPAGTTAPSGTPKVKVWAYRGKPMYTFVDDDEPGDTLGSEINYFARSNFHVLLVPGPGIY